MGRRKIEIKKIENPARRQVTFTKRSLGLVKKARELSELCDVQVQVTILSGNKNKRVRVFNFPSGEVLDDKGENDRQDRNDSQALRLIVPQSTYSSHNQWMGNNGDFARRVPVRQGLETHGITDHGGWTVPVCSSNLQLSHTLIDRFTVPNALALTEPNLQDFWGTMPILSSDLNMQNSTSQSLAGPPTVPNTLDLIVPWDDWDFWPTEPVWISDQHMRSAFSESVADGSTVSNTPDQTQPNVQDVWPTMTVSSSNLLEASSTSGQSPPSPSAVSSTLDLLQANFPDSCPTTPGSFLWEPVELFDMSIFEGDY